MRSSICQNEPPTSFRTTSVPCMRRLVWPVRFSAMTSIVEMWRYPVKSMAGERLDSCVVTAAGLEGDRRWALIDHTPNRDGKWFNIKQHAPLLTYGARLVDGRPGITAADGTRIGLDEAFRRVVDESQRSVELRELPGGNFDAAPVHIVNLASVAAFGLEAGMDLDRRRFRANLYLDGLEAEEEVSWLGRRIVAGDAELEVVARCVRCAVITRDPDTTVATPDALEVLVQRHEKCMGVYCDVLKAGRIAVGDFVGPAPA